MLYFFRVDTLVEFSRTRDIIVGIAGWTAHISNPGMARAFFCFLSLADLTLGFTQLPVQWVPASITGDKAAGSWF
jgi:hypothetical protein